MNQNVDSIDHILSQNLSSTHLEFVNSIIYGVPKLKELEFGIISKKKSSEYSIDIKGYSFEGTEKVNEISETTKPTVRVAVFQNGIVEPTYKPIEEQKNSLYSLAEKALEIAHLENANVFCFQEMWNCPMFFCTQKKLPWTEFGEDVFNGPTTLFLKNKAVQYNMVIVSPILERDQKDHIWNTAVVIDDTGEVLGFTRKHHIPISGKYSETYFYNPSALNHKVFQTIYGRIGVNICYDRHHPQHWYSLALEKAEIVFNPSATVDSFSEYLWPIEARSAAASFGYYTCAINRVGTESFIKENSDEVEKIGKFFGSSYIISPDGRKSPGLSISRNGILFADLDLNLTREIKESEKNLRYFAGEFIKASS